MRSITPVHDVLKLPADGIIRVSLVHYNSVEEVRGFVKVLENVVANIGVAKTNGCWRRECRRMKPMG